MSVRQHGRKLGILDSLRNQEIAGSGRIGKDRAAESHALERRPNLVVEIRAKRLRTGGSGVLTFGGKRDAARQVTGEPAVVEIRADAIDRGCFGRRHDAVSGQRKQNPLPVKIVITGGSGFIGRRLAIRLLQRSDVESIVSFDVARSRGGPVEDRRFTELTGDIADFSTVRELIGLGTSSVFHLGAVVSAGAEADFDLGMRVNLEGTRNVLEACRRLPLVPRLVFGSSEAVYGGALPPVIDDDTPLYPQTSYGTQKACGELLVSDYTRKGFVDGRSLRFPTIIVRPEPNLAASTFTSTIVREPLLGRQTICPVREDSVLALMSVNRVIECIERAHDLDGGRFGTHRSLLLPAVSASVREMIEAVRRVGGDEAAARITMQPDPIIQGIVDTWPRAVSAARAQQLGFQADADIDAIVGKFVAEISVAKR